MTDPDEREMVNAREPSPYSTRVENLAKALARCDGSPLWSNYLRQAKKLVSEMGEDPAEWVRRLDEAGQA